MDENAVKSSELMTAEAQPASRFILDDYIHVKQIGEGAFSVVKHYNHKMTGRECAVKELLDSTYAHWFEREIRIMKELAGHEHIAELIDHQCEGGKFLYITPKAETNLYKYIKRHNQSLTLAHRVAIFDQIISAIKYAHSKDILHRDIAPPNVLLMKGAEGFLIKVSDFGLGKDLKSLSHFSRSRLSRYGQPFYVAPEQREKLENATARSDVYSLGKLLNFILTGRDPDVIHPCDFTSVIERATQYDPALRYQNIVEFEEAYEKIKALLFIEEKPGEPQTLSGFVGVTDEINWLEFHRLAAKGDVVDHVYFDYVFPVIDVLNRNGNLQKYYAVVGNSIEEFVDTFIQRLNDLASVLGWPFKETTTFGKLLKDIFTLVDNSKVKLMCLKEIWDLAYEQDQWGVQPIMQALLDVDIIPSEIQTPFAAHILDSSANVSLEMFSRLRLPTVIRQALIRKSKS